MAKSDVTPIFCQSRFQVMERNDSDVVSTVINESSRTALESARRYDCSAKRTIKF